MLEVLLAARGAVVSSEELLDRVWDENADPFTTTVRVTVMTLRRKLGEPGAGRDRGRRRLPGAGWSRPRCGRGVRVIRWPRPALTLRLRLTLLYGGLLAVVAATLLGAAVVVLDRALRSLPQFPPGVRLRFGDGTSLTAAQFSELVRDSARGELLRSAGLVFAVTALVGVAAAYVLAGRALQPVSRVTSTARRLSRGDAGPADRAGRAAGRAQGAGRHVRRDAGPAGRRVRQPAPVRRERQRTSCAPRWR